MSKLNHQCVVSAKVQRIFFKSLRRAPVGAFGGFGKQHIVITYHQRRVRKDR
jgi:hypothetical protein